VYAERVKYIAVGIVALAVAALWSLAPATVGAKCPNPGPPRGDDYLHYYHQGTYYTMDTDVGGIYSTR
jgi:hypothetical protein